MISPELQNKVDQYIRGIITLRELEEWIIPRSPSILRNPESANADVYSAIELGLAEIDDEILTEEEFRAFLNEMLEKHATTRRVAYPSNMPETTTESSSKTVEQSYTWPSTSSVQYTIS